MNELSIFLVVLARREQKIVVWTLCIYLTEKKREMWGKQESSSGDLGAAVVAASKSCLITSVAPIFG